MSVIREEFGANKAGETIYLYTITNNKGMSVKVMNYGANLVQVNVPDKDGNTRDVVLGFDEANRYFENGSFFGAAVGPCANRTANAQFAIDGTVYHLDVNDGPNNLHSHMENGYHKRMWDAQYGEDFVKFSLKDTDGNLGLPGNRLVELTYTLSEDNRIRLHYYMESDKKTLFNMTNHSYFNLKGQGNGNIEDHVITIKASHYLPVVPGAIPTGEIAPVAGTVMDFTTPYTIGERVREDFEQLVLTKGYDHNWVLDDFDGSVQLVASAESAESGITMKAYTNLPGMQFYAGNCIGEESGKGGTMYGARSGFCFETQFYPDCANQSQFPSAIFGPDRAYDYTTIYEFGVKA